MVARDEHERVAARARELQRQPDGVVHVDQLGERALDTRGAALRWDSARLSDLLASGERSVDIASIVSVTPGIATDLLRRKLGRGEIFGGHADRFYSLVTPARTIDLEAASTAQARVLVRAFSFLTRARNRPLERLPHAR